MASSSPFDLIYASAVLNHFGAEDLRHLKGVKDELYSKQAGYETSVDKQTRDEAKKKYNTACQNRAANRENEDELEIFDMITVLPYINLGAEKMQHIFRKAEERAKAVEQAASVEKVEQWRVHLE